MPVEELAHNPLDFYAFLCYHTCMKNEMNQTELVDAISIAFYNLSELSGQVYDYWLMKLYNAEGDMIAEEWNTQTLKWMEDDVMQLTLVTEEN